MTADRRGRPTPLISITSPTCPCSQRACPSRRDAPSPPTLCRWLDVPTRVSDEPPDQSRLRQVGEYPGAWAGEPLTWIVLASLVISWSDRGQ